jgi:hypothetical protein
VEGYRYQVFVTDLADTDICYLEYLEALYRGRVISTIRDAIADKHRWLANLPAAASPSSWPGSPS